MFILLFFNSVRKNATDFPSGDQHGLSSEYGAGGFVILVNSLPFIGVVQICVVG
jgi:hypothetical protein